MAFLKHIHSDLGFYRIEGSGVEEVTLGRKTSEVSAAVYFAIRLPLRAILSIPCNNHGTVLGFLLQSTTLCYFWMINFAATSAVDHCQHLRLSQYFFAAQTTENACIE